jgi:hypothetical protein
MASLPQVVAIREPVDEIVIRAMQKWPNVPNVFGWLRLDRRGNWLVKARQARDAQPVFERIANEAVVDFIGRNYAHDDAGRWYFQNGPQRVFVALEYTPHVYRLRGDGESLETHTGRAVDEVRAAWIDDAGMLVLETELGPGVLLDRDLHALLDRIETASGPVSEESLAELTAGALPDLALVLGRRRVPLSAIKAAEVPARFGFNPAPAPAPGEPEC